MNLWAFCSSCGQEPIKGPFYTCNTCPAGPKGTLCERCYKSDNRGLHENCLDFDYEEEEMQTEDLLEKWAKFEKGRVSVMPPNNNNVLLLRILLDETVVIGHGFFLPESKCVYTAWHSMNSCLAPKEAIFFDLSLPLSSSSSWTCNKMTNMRLDKTRQCRANQKEDWFEIPVVVEASPTTAAAGLSSTTTSCFIVTGNGTFPMHVVEWNKESSQVVLLFDEDDSDEEIPLISGCPCVDENGKVFALVTQGGRYKGKRFIGATSGFLK